MVSGSIAGVKNLPVVVASLLLVCGATAHATPASDAAFDKGKTMSAAKDYAGAAAQFEIVVAADPNNDQGWYRLASASRQAGHCDRAVVAYKKYMDLVPNMPDPYYGLGLCLLKTGDNPGALAALKHFVAVAPASNYRTHAASVVEDLSAPSGGKPAAAAPADGAAAKPAAVSPGQAAYIDAQALRDRGHIEEAIVKFKQAFALDPRHWAARTALGELLLKIRRDDEAVAALRATVEKNPAYSLAWYDLAFALRVKGQHAAAVDAYDHYIKLKTGRSRPRRWPRAIAAAPGSRRRRATRVRDLSVAREAPERATLGRVRGDAAQDAGGFGEVARGWPEPLVASRGSSRVKVEPLPGRLSTFRVPP